MDPDDEAADYSDEKASDGKQIGVEKLKRIGEIGPPSDDVKAPFIAPLSSETVESSVVDGTAKDFKDIQPTSKSSSLPRSMPSRSAHRRASSRENFEIQEDIRLLRKSSNYIPIAGPISEFVP